MNIDIEKKAIPILLFFIVIAFFIPLSLAPLFDLDEGAFSEATREMLVGRDYITTYLNGELRFDKPILIYWFQLISVKTFGLNEFALRLPSAIAGTFWAGGIYFFTKKLFNTQIAFFSTLFMISSLQINMIAKAAIADSLLNLFIALSMFSIYLFFQNRENRYIYWTFLFVALGTLTKGPVAIMIPLIVSLILFLNRKEFKLWLKMVFNPIGILIFLAVALPWYIAEYMAQEDAFINGFFFKHNLSRFSSAMETHSGSIFYFIPVLLIGMMPFTYFVIRAIGGVKSYIKDDFKLYLFIWFAFVFIFFSFSGTKLPHYIIYGYTPIFILSALYIQSNINKKWLFYPLIGFLILLLFLPDIATTLQEYIRDKLAVVLIKNAYNTFDIWYRVSIILLIIFLLWVYKKIKSNDTILLSIALSMIIMVNYIVIPTYGKLMQQPIKEAGELAKSRGYKDIIAYKVNTPSFNVYYEGLVSKAKPKIGDIVFTKVPKLKDFKAYQTLYRKNGFALIKVEKQ
ncbi:MAG TPA: glycosyltransferase family 39 protein [Campylobacterales bacterium]|nr:glycosyltransferase family 39 protein [Campylobacterales bacterium]